jgi:hypothetical protein
MEERVMTPRALIDASSAILFLAVFIALAATQHLWSHGPRSAEDRILHFLSTTAGV